MSINGINGTSGAARVTPSATDAAASARAGAAGAVPADLKQEEADDKQTSVHFPWLSRLSAELEAASNKRARFPTQIMGDNLNRQA